MGARNDHTCRERKIALLLTSAEKPASTTGRRSAKAEAALTNRAHTCPPSPCPQPRNFIGGQLISATVGITTRVREGGHGAIDVR